MNCFVNHEGFYAAVTEPLTITPIIVPKAPVSLTDPSNIFFMQNTVSNNLNQFQNQYSRYMRCQAASTYNQVQDPPCDVDGQDSFGNLNSAYRSLLSSIQDLSNSYPNQTHLDAKTPEQYQMDAKKLPMDYASIVKMRQDLDEQLKFLYMQMDKGPDTPVKMLESTMYANTMWIILATCLVYYVFIELK